MSWGYTKHPEGASFSAADNFGVKLSAIDNFSGTFLRFNKMVDKSTRRLIKLRAAMNRIARVSKMVFAGLAASIGLAVKQFAKLEERVREITTLMDGEAQDAVTGLMNKFMKMSNSLPQSADKLADAFYDIKSALPYVDDVEKLMDVLQVSAKAAVAGRTTTEISARAIVGVMNAFGESQQNAKHVADVLFQTVRKGVIRFEDLAKEIGTVATVAKTSNVEFEELAAEMATLTKAGLNAAMSATFLRGAYRMFLKPQNEAIEQAEKLGIELNSTTLEAYGLFGAIKQLKDEGANAQEIAKMFPNIRGMQAVMAIINNFDKYQQVLKDMYNADNMSEVAFQKMMETLANQIQVLINQIQNFAIVFGSLFVGDIKKWTSNFGNFLERFQALSAEQKEFIANSVKMALKITGLISSISILAKLIGFLTNPIFLVIGAMALLYASWNENWLGIRDITLAVWDSIQNIWTKVSEGLDFSINWLENKMSPLWKWVKETLIPWSKKTGNKMKMGFSFVWEEGKKLFDSLFRSKEKGLFWRLLDRSGNAVKISLGWVRENSNKMWTWIDENLIPWIKNKGMPAITAIFKVGLNWLGDYGEALKNGIKNGDWGEFNKRTAKIAAILLGLKLAPKAISALITSIKSGLIASPFFGAAGVTSAVTSAIAAVYLALRISDDIKADKTGKELVDTIISTLAGGTSGFFVGGVPGAAIGITASLKLGIGEAITSGSVSDKLNEWTKKLEDFSKYLRETTDDTAASEAFMEGFNNGEIDTSKISETFKKISKNPFAKAGIEIAKIIWNSIELFFTSDRLISDLLRNLISRFEDKFIEFGGNIAGAIWKGLKDYFTEKNFFKVLFGEDNVFKKVKESLGINSPQEGGGGGADKLKMLLGNGFVGGGYTGDGLRNEIAGYVHKGEYVIPKNIVQRNPALISMLERKRTKGYDTGGYTGFESSFLSLGMNQVESPDWESMTADEIRKNFEEGFKDIPKMLKTSLEKGLDLLLSTGKGKEISEAGTGFTKEAGGAGYQQTESFELGNVQKGMLNMLQIVLQLSGAFDKYNDKVNDIIEDITGTGENEPPSEMDKNPITVALRETGKHIRDLVDPATMFKTILGDLEYAGKATKNALKGFRDWIVKNSNIGDFMSFLVKKLGEWDIPGKIKEGWDKIKDLNQRNDGSGMGTWTNTFSQGFKDLFRTRESAQELNTKSRKIGGPSNNYSEGSLSFITEALEPLSSAFKTLQGFIGGLFGKLGPMIEGLSSVSALLSPIKTILKGIMSIIGPMINQALAPLVGILKIVGQTIGRILVPVFKLLGAIIYPVAELFVTVYNALLPVFNGLIWIFTKLANGVIAIVRGIATAFNWLPGVNINKPDYLDSDDMELSEISMDDAQEGGGANTAGGGTTYQAGSEQNVTNNFHFTYDGAVFTKDEQSAKEFIDWVIDKLDERDETVVT